MTKRHMSTVSSSWWNAAFWLVHSAITCRCSRWPIGWSVLISLISWSVWSVDRFNRFDRFQAMRAFATGRHERCEWLRRSRWCLRTTTICLSTEMRHNVWCLQLFCAERSHDNGPDVTSLDDKVQPLVCYCFNILIKKIWLYINTYFNNNHFKK